MTELAPSRRNVLTGMAALPLIGLPTIISAQTMPLRSSAFASFAAAVREWGQRGGTLLIDRDHVEPLPVTLGCVPGLSYHLTSDAPRRIAYGGPQTSWLFAILGRGGNPLRIDGELDFDGRNACSMPFFARYELVSGNARRDCTVSGLTARNARMRRGRSRIDGSDTAGYGATAMLFAGGFDRLHLQNVGAFNASRDRGAGRPGSQGSVGIGITANLASTSSARHVTIQDFVVEHIGTDDAPGPARVDMDGVLVFQTAEASGSRPIIRRGVIREAAGRAVKIFAPGGGGLTSQLDIYRSVIGAPGGSVDVNHQHGDGTIESIRLFYSGAAHATPSASISMATGYQRAAGFAFTEGVIRNITMADTTGRPKRALIGLQYNERDSAARRFRINDITDNGSAEYLFLPGALGTYGPATISLERVNVNLTRSLLATEDETVSLSLRARGFTNRNTQPVPVRTYYDGRAAAARHRVRFDRDASVRGLGD